MSSIGCASPVQDFASAVEQARAAVASMTALTVDGVWSQIPVAALAELTSTLVAVRDGAGALVTAGVAAVHAAGALPPGQVSTRRWLESQGLAGRSASAELGRVRDLHRFPRTRLAWLSGDLTADQVRALTLGARRAFQRLDVADSDAAIALLEEQVLPHAPGMTVAEITRLMARFRFVLDPDGADADALSAYDDQTLTLTPVGDGFDVTGYLSRESGAMVLTCLDRIIDGWHRDGTLADPRARPGSRSRNRAHQHALALADLAEQLLGAGTLGTRHGVKPHVTLTVDAGDYVAGLGGDLRIPGIGPRPVTAATIDRILCDADLTTVLTRHPHRRNPTTGPDTSRPVDTSAPDDIAAWLAPAAREVLYVGRTHRTATPRQRTALAVREGGHCAFPGCTVDADRCHAHHITPWEHGGHTDLDTMTLLCHGHHHLVHEGRWTITRRPGARPGQPHAWQFDPPEPRP